MRSEKSVNNQEKEPLEFFNIEEEAEKARKSNMIFFVGGTQERKKINREIEEFFPRYSEERTESFRDYRLKKKLFWLFIECFSRSDGIPLKELIDGIEKYVILRTLSRVNGNQKDAAKILGVKYTTLNEKTKRYSIHFRKEPS